MTFKITPFRQLKRCRPFGLQITARCSLLAGITSGLAIFGGLTHQARAASWTSFTFDTFVSNGFRTTALAHLPDGRFIYGVGRYGMPAQLFVQKDFEASVTNNFDVSEKTTIPTNSLTLDPSFVAVHDASNALVGQGSGANVYKFNPSSPSAGVNTTALVVPPLVSPQNYAGVYWKAPSPIALEGWLVAGTNWLVAGSDPPAYDHNVVFISLDGTKTGPITSAISTYSGGIAVDAAGNLYAATYEIDENWEPTAAANRVLKFSAAHVEAAIQAVITGSPAPMMSSTFLYQFDSTSNIAVDSLGRVWATGYAVNHLQVFDPATQTMSRVVPQHGPFPSGADVLYTLGHFTRNGVSYLSFLAQDEEGNALTNVYTGYAPDSSIVIPHIDQWRAQKFGDVHNLTLAMQANVWGPEADPDHDGAFNLVEYAVGTSPTSPDVSPITIGRSAGQLQFSFVRDPLNTDLTYAVEVSTTLAPGGWQEIARSTAGAATINRGAGSVSEIAEGARIRVTVTDSLSIVPKFARLRVILSPP